MKDGLKTVCNPCGDETSMVKEEENTSIKTPRYSFYEYPEMVRL